MGEIHLYRISQEFTCSLPGSILTSAGYDFNLWWLIIISEPFFFYFSNKMKFSPLMFLQIKIKPFNASKYPMVFSCNIWYWSTISGNKTQQPFYSLLYDISLWLRPLPPHTHTPVGFLTLDSWLKIKDVILLQHFIGNSDVEMRFPC